MKYPRFNTSVLFFVGFISCLSIYSQDRKAYRTKMTEGIKLFEERNYPVALETLLSAYQIDSSNANLNYRIGFCYLNAKSDKTKAISFLEKASTNLSRNFNPYDPTDERAPKNVYSLLGEAYLLNNSFEKARENYSKFKEELGDNEEAQREVKKQIESCEVAKELTANPTKTIITNLGIEINTEYPEYCPIINGDESVLIFTSRRPYSTSESYSNIDTDGRYLEDIYMCRKKGSSWGSPELVSISSPDENKLVNKNNAAVSITGNGQQLLIYKEDNGGDIWASELEGDFWGEAKPLKTDETDINDINTPYWETHACLSVDGTTLFFVSNRPGGYGGRDIYRCVKLPNGKWSKATNLGSTINTAFDEDAPFIHPDGVTLIFSSNGHRTMGGFDIFYSSRRNADKEKGWKWTLPTNMGCPINTTDDDVFYALSTDGKRAYFSSGRAGGLGEKDLYMAEMEQTIIEPTVLLKGSISFDGKDGNVGIVRISVVDMESGEIVQEIKPNSKTGGYVMILNPGENGKTFIVNYEADGFQPFVENLKIEPGSSYQVIERALNLRSINLESKALGTIAVTGALKNKEGKPIPGAKIIVKSNTTGELIDTYFSNSTTGKYYMVLNRGENFNLSFEAEGYLFHSENIDTPKENEYSQVVNDIAIEQIKEDATIILNNLFFDSNKSILKKESTVELEKVYKFLAENPNVSVEISGHTDSQGKPDANLALSKARAKAVVTYLTNSKNKIYRVAPYYYKGIDPKRLIIKGYGSTQPIASNTLPDGKPDPAGMKMNRRVEFKIISTKTPLPTGGIIGSVETKTTTTNKPAIKTSTTTSSVKSGTTTAAV